MSAGAPDAIARRAPLPDLLDTALVRAWIGVAILWLFYILAMMDRGVIALMVGPLMRDLGISAVQVGLLQGFAFAFMYTVAALPLGWAVDHSSRRFLLIAGVLLWSTGTIGCGLAPTFTHMVIARAFVGLGEAVLIPTSLSLIADMFPRQRIATATAVLSSGATVGAGAALILGGSLLRGFEVGAARSLFGGLHAWSSVFLIFGSLGVLAAWLAFLVPDRRRRPLRDDSAAADEPATMAEFGRFMRMHIAVLAYVFLTFPLLVTVTAAFLSWAPRHLEVAFSWNVQKVGLVVGVLKLIVAPLGVVCGGLAMDRALRSGIKAPYFVIPLFTTVTGGPLLAAGLLQRDPILAVALLTIGTFLFFAFASSHYVVLQVLAPPSMRGRLTALYLMTISLIGTGLGSLLPPLLASLAKSSGDDLGRATAIVIVVISLFVAAALASGRGRLHAALTDTQKSRGLI
jgi:MFS family permease